MKKRLILFGLFAFLPSSLLFAFGEDGQVTITPTYEFYGNTPRDRNVDLSTTNVVLLSSRAADATVEINTTTTLGIATWRFREIVNVSTCAALALYSRNTPPYNVFSTSYSVILSSDPGGLGAGDAYAVPHQDQVWGVWTSASGNGSCAAGAGAVVTEVYQHSKRKR